MTICCNASYFYEYGGNFIASFAQSAGRGGHLHLHVMDPDADFERCLSRLRDQLPALHLAVIAEDTRRLSGNDPVAAKTYYSCGRFMLLPALLLHYRKPVLCLDVDTVVESNLDRIAGFGAGQDVALLRREPLDSPWLDYVANIVVANPTDPAIRYFTLVGNYIRHYARRKMLHWHLDQVALYCVMQMLNRFSEPPKVAWIPRALQEQVWHIGHAYDHKLDSERFTRYSVRM